MTSKTLKRLTVGAFAAFLVLVGALSFLVSLVLLVLSVFSLGPMTKNSLVSNK
jgi:hypothetical protein